MKGIAFIYFSIFHLVILCAATPYAGPAPEMIGTFTSGDSINIQKSYTTSPGVSSFRFVLTRATTVDIKLTNLPDSSTSNAKIQGIWKGISMDEDYCNLYSNRALLSLEAGTYVFLCFTTHARMGIEMMFFDPYTIETSIDKIQPYAGPIPEYVGEKKNSDIINYNYTFASAPNATCIEFTLIEPSIVDVNLAGSSNGCVINSMWKGTSLTDAYYNINSKRTRLNLGVGSYVIRFVTTNGLLLKACINFYKTNIVLPDTPSEINPEIRPEADIIFSDNYIHTRSYRAADQSAWLDNFNYFDGLGRLIQQTDVKITPDQRGDLVTMLEYDAFGRVSKTWLPAVAKDNNGAFVASNLVRNKAIATYSDSMAYSCSFSESSSESRIVQKNGPGKDWTTNKKNVKKEYLTNTVGNGVLSCMSIVMDNTLEIKGFISQGKLFIIKTLDEDDNCIYEFKNWKGQTILIRQMNGSEMNDTYFVHDAFGNLCAVVPPMASREVTTNNWTEAIDKYVYLNQYDAKNRCIAKKLPGCEWIYYVYDKANRQIFMQNGENRNKGEWQFSIPDTFGRIVLNGICRNSLNYATNPLGNIIVKATYNANRTNLANSYTITGITLSTPTILSVNYYDNYDFRGIVEIPSNGTEYNAETGFGVWYSGNYTEANKYKNKNMLTGMLTAQQLPDGTISATYIYSVMYYDNRGRLIQSKGNNHLAGGIEKEYIAYNFTGQPTLRKYIHSATGKTTQTATYVYGYDNAGRLLTTKHRLNTGPEILLTNNEYDELGRVKSNKRNGISNLALNYTYNIRSWTKSITGTLFNQTLYYNDTYTSGTVPRYSGDISAMTWTISGEGKKRGYNFLYDDLSRLKAANYIENDVTSTNYSTSYTYDKQGNVLSLIRNGRTGTTTFGVIDQMAFTYNGNQLKNIAEIAATPSLSQSADFRKNTALQTTEYFYDRNGNLTKDLNKGISEISYNLLNLPTKILISNAEGSATNTYVYSASGVKLSVVKNWGNGSQKTDYVGSLIYENGTLKRTLIEGGYIENDVYHFFLTDHLGNNRVVAKADGTVVQTNHYYPFGMTFADGITTSKQPYKYNGKELDSERRINWYDYEARHMDPAILRFTTMDPLCEKYYSWSPYAYCANNPVKYIDPDGKELQIPPVVLGLNTPILGTSNPLYATGRNIGMLGTSDKVVRALPKEEHHVTPRSLKGDPVLESARKGGFKLEGAENKMQVDKFSKAAGEGQHGKHPNYTKQIGEKLQKFANESPDATPKQAAKFVRQMVSDAKTDIMNNPSTKINELKLNQQVLPTDNIREYKPEIMEKEKISM